MKLQGENRSSNLGKASDGSILRVSTQLATHLLCALVLASILFASNTTGQQDAESYQHKCYLNYNFQLPSDSINFTAYALTVRGDEAKPNLFTRFFNSLLRNDDCPETEFALEEIPANATADDLDALKLNLDLPFLFITNGFNAFYPNFRVSETWMGEIAETIIRRYRNSCHLDMRANLVLMTWNIPLFGVNLDVAEVITSYYKTVSNYATMVRLVSESVLKLIKYVDLKRNWADEDQLRLDYYSKFDFYGHSLGSHLNADAVKLVAKSESEHFRFGTLAGFDAAAICFLDAQHGLLSIEQDTIVKNILLLHSNAGMFGLVPKRGDIEILLNGGSFQTGCLWYDLECHHVRAVKVLTYLDDECQMVAYRCTSYAHFKYGACATCDDTLFGDPIDAAANKYAAQQCFLVNLPEQHVDSNELTRFVASHDNQARQVARETNFSSNFYFKKSKLNETTSATSSNATKPTENKQPSREYHYVNTNPNFRLRGTHCLQHYQARLLISSEADREKRACPINLFYQVPSNQVQVVFVYDDDDVEKGNFRRKLMSLSDEWTNDEWKYVESTKMFSVVVSTFYTKLLNFEGKPKLFTGALINNIDLEKLSDCLRSQKVSDGLHLFLDIAFMSHTNEKVRNTFSSMLCARIDPNKDYSEKGAELTLGLCKKSELAEFKEQLQSLTRQMRNEHLGESWQLTLMNSLFALFLQWAPF